MIRDKIFLILGIVLLSSGILLRLLTDYSILPKLIILTGIAFKYLYLSAIIKNYGYKVGKEFIVLSIGLVLFLTGLILKNNNYNCIYRNNFV